MVHCVTVSSDLPKKIRNSKSSFILTYVIVFPILMCTTVHVHAIINMKHLNSFIINRRQTQWFCGKKIQLGALKIGYTMLY